MSGRVRALPEPVAAYLAKLPQPDRKALEHVRRIVLAKAPEASERIAYGIPVFAVDGDLVGIGSQTQHLSFYTMSPELVAGLADRIRPFRIGGSSTIHFTAATPLPDGLVEEIVERRLAENAARHVRGSAARS